MHNDRSGLDSRSNSPVPNHGATSVPSMSLFLETRFYCSILLRLHRSFKVSIGLDEASSPSRWAYPYFHCLLCIGYRTGVVASPKLLINRFHTVACTRRRTDGYGTSIRISLRLRSLRSTVTGLIGGPHKSSSSHRKHTWYLSTACSMFQTSA